MTVETISSVEALDALPVGQVIDSRIVAARKVERPAGSGNTSWACTDGDRRTSADMVLTFAPLWVLERPSAARHAAALTPRALADAVVSSVRVHGVPSIKAALAVFGLRIEVAPDGR